ncbi:MAG TPA: ABC transporter ATP-binding protein [Tepidisphaeraceae bacterium]|nr:ABC transporter ATP-binding protein [Tepidisphaeraceae bacterium]
MFTRLIPRFSRQIKLTGSPGAVALPAIESEGEARYKPISFAMVRRLLTYLTPYRKTYVTGIVVGLLHVLLDLLSPAFIGLLIAVCAGYLDGTLHITAGEAKTRLALIMVLWGLAFTGSVLLQRWCIILMTRAGESVQFDLRQKMFAHLQLLSMSYYDKTKLGRIISRLTSDINALREVNVWGVWQIIANAMIMLVAAAAMAWTDYRLFLAVCWLGIPLFILTRIYLRTLGRQQQVVREWWTRVSTNLAENITGMRVVTAYDRQAPNLGVFNRLQEQNTSNNVSVARTNGIYQPLLEAIRNTGRAIVLLFGGYLIATGRIGKAQGVGAVVAAFWYWDWFMGAIITLGNFINQLMMAMAGGERVFNLLDTPPDVHDLPTARPLPRIKGDVTFENVTFGYNPERPVLHDISFEARAGQTFALVGHTGSGKSSIVSLIARFYQPQQGRVLVDGIDVRTVTGESLHRQMGLVLQVNYLFTGTVIENIRYSKPDATDEQVFTAARQLGTFDAIMTLKQGFDTDVGERGANMSLGQRQLICFTRAYLADPRIFMLDEATSAVDTATEMLVQQSLEKLLAGRTTFIVAHRLSTIMRADMILVLDHGRIVESGTHAALLRHEGKYAELYRQFAQSAAGN